MRYERKGISMDMNTNEQKTTLKQQAEAVRDELRSMDVASGRARAEELASEGRRRLLALSRRVLLALAVVIIAVLYGGYSMFLSPEAQVRRAYTEVMEVVEIWQDKSPTEYTEADIDRMLEIVPPARRVEVHQRLNSIREQARRTGDTSTLNIASNKISPKNYQITGVSVNGDSARVGLADKKGEQKDIDYLVKIDGNWYVRSLAGEWSGRW